MLPANAVDSVKDILGLQAKEYVSHRTRVSTHGMHEIPERTIRVSRPRASGEAVIKSPKKAVIQHPDGTVSYMIPSYSRGKMLGDPSFELAGGLGSLVGDQWYRVLPQQLTDELEELARRELALYYNKRNKPWKSKAPADLAREWIGHMAAENIGAPNLTAGIPREFTSKIAPLLKRSQARETVKGEMEIAQEVARRQAEHEAQKLSTTEAILNKLNTLRRRILRGAEPLPTQQADIEEATKVLQGLLGTKPPEGGI